MAGDIFSATMLDVAGGSAVGGSGGGGGAGTGGAAGNGGNGDNGKASGGTAGAGGSADGTGGAGGGGGAATGGSIDAVTLAVTGDAISETLLKLAGGSAMGGAGGAGRDGTGAMAGHGGDGGNSIGSLSNPNGGAGGAGGSAYGTGGYGGAGGDAMGGSIGTVIVSVTGGIISTTTLEFAGGSAAGGVGGAGGIGQGGTGGEGGNGGSRGPNTIIIPEIPHLSNGAGGAGGAGGSADGTGAAGGAGGAAIGGGVDAVTVSVTGDVISATKLDIAGGSASGGAGGAGGNGTGGTAGNGGTGGSRNIDAVGGDGGTAGAGGTGGSANGTGGAGGDGGNATGGDANITMTSSGTITLTGDDAITITAKAGDATGGNGGAGGIGTGGTAGTGGAVGEGGDAAAGENGSADGLGGAGGAGGSATGGDVHVTLSNSSAINVTGGNAITIIAEAGNATGGDGGAAGSGTGGTALNGTGGVGGGVQSGNATVAVTNNGGINATGNGIDITATAGTGIGGAGDTAELNSAGINGSSSITVSNSSVVDVGGIGVRATAKGDNGTIAINNIGGTITGGLGGVVVATDLAFVEHSDIDIVNSGLISSGDLLAAAAIDAKGASAEILNSGTVLGFMDLTEADDTIDNQAGGVFAARGTSDFRGGVDVFTNSGTVVAAGDIATDEDVVLQNLERFDNSRLITMVDGRAGDTLTMTGATLYASTGGSLAVDAVLGAPGTGKSDMLIIDGATASTSGMTRVSVNVTGLSGANSDGITVVEMRNGATTHEGDFVLDGGSLNVGLFTWDMRQSGGTFELFSSGIGTGAYEFAAGITGMQDIWYQTTGTLLQRQADLRPLLKGTQVTPVADFSEPVAPTPAGQIGPGFWMKGAGAWLERDQGNNETATDRKQSIYGGLVGFDFATEGARDAWLFGLYGGYLGSKLKFNETDTEWTYNGPTVGAYATYLNQALYVDMLVKADFLNINIDPDKVAPAADDEDTDGVNVGGMIDAGYKFGGDEGLFLEPQATVAVLYTSIDDVDMLGGNVDFDDETSVRGRLGLRVGYDHTAANQVVYSSDVTASVWQELNGGDNDATIVTTDFPAFAVVDEPGETVGDISLGFSVTAPESWSGFVRGNYQFSDDLDAIAGSVGLRYSW
ncbi:MAG: autotransporter outer membrane beta-barrel domain-containing protein [Pseudomonadota bacterium]